MRIVHGYRAFMANEDNDNDNEQASEGSEKDAPGVRHDHEAGNEVIDPKTAAEMAQPAADRAESESREGRTEP